MLISKHRAFPTSDLDRRKSSVRLCWCRATEFVSIFFGLYDRKSWSFKLHEEEFYSIDIMTKLFHSIPLHFWVITADRWNSVISPYLNILFENMRWIITVSLILCGIHCNIYIYMDCSRNMASFIVIQGSEGRLISNCLKTYTLRRFAIGYS